MLEDLKAKQRLEKEIVEGIKNKNVLIINYNNKDKLKGKISSVTLTQNMKTKDVSILFYDILLEEENKTLTQMSLGKDFIPEETKITKLEIDKKILKDENFLFDINRIGNISDKIVKVLEDEEVYGVILKNNYNKKTKPKSLDTIFVTKKNNINDIISLKELPLKFVSNIKEIEQNLFKEPLETEMTNRYNLFVKENLELENIKKAEELKNSYSQTLGFN